MSSRSSRLFVMLFVVNGLAQSRPHGARSGGGGQYGPYPGQGPGSGGGGQFLGQDFAPGGRGRPGPSRGGGQGSPRFPMDEVAMADYDLGGGGPRGFGGNSMGSMAKPPQSGGMPMGKIVIPPRQPQHAAAPPLPLRMAPPMAAPPPPPFDSVMSREIRDPRIMIENQRSIFSSVLSIFGYSLLVIGAGVALFALIKWRSADETSSKSSDKKRTSSSSSASENSSSTKKDKKRSHHHHKHKKDKKKEIKVKDEKRKKKHKKKKDVEDDEDSMIQEAKKQPEDTSETTKSFFVPLPDDDESVSRRNDKYRKKKDRKKRDRKKAKRRGREDRKHERREKRREKRLEQLRRHYQQEVEALEKEADDERQDSLATLETSTTIEDNVDQSFSSTDVISFDDKTKHLKNQKNRIKDPSSESDDDSENSESYWIPVNKKMQETATISGPGPKQGDQQQAIIYVFKSSVAQIDQNGVYISPADLQAILPLRGHSSQPENQLSETLVQSKPIEPPPQDTKDPGLSPQSSTVLFQAETLKTAAFGAKQKASISPQSSRTSSRRVVLTNLITKRPQTPGPLKDPQSNSDSFESSLILVKQEAPKRPKSLVVKNPRGVINKQQQPHSPGLMVQKTNSNRSPAIKSILRGGPDTGGSLNSYMMEPKSPSPPYGTPPPSPPRSPLVKMQKQQQPSSGPGPKSPRLSLKRVSFSRKLQVRFFKK